ncbi:hypothetical protein FRC17_009600 [Serendipita sp. 399]|nr:hypothetical protein FRC17_009600 [Serendipita sp. 399]
MRLSTLGQFIYLFFIWSHLVGAAPPFKRKRTDSGGSPPDVEMNVAGAPAASPAAAGPVVDLASPPTSAVGAGFPNLAAIPPVSAAAAAAPILATTHSPAFPTGRSTRSRSRGGSDPIPGASGLHGSRDDQGYSEADFPEVTLIQLTNACNNIRTETTEIMKNFEHPDNHDRMPNEVTLSELVSHALLKEKSVKLKFQSQQKEGETGWDWRVQFKISRADFGKLAARRQPKSKSPSPSPSNRGRSPRRGSTSKSPSSREKRRAKPDNTITDLPMSEEPAQDPASQMPDVASSQLPQASGSQQASSPASPGDPWVWIVILVQAKSFHKNLKGDREPERVAAFTYQRHTKAGESPADLQMNLLERATSALESTFKQQARVVLVSHLDTNY